MGPRSLSFGSEFPKEGDPRRVTYERLTHHLSEDQKAQYDAMAEAWQNVFANIGAAVENTGDESGRQKAAAIQQFWGSQQRFFNQVLTSMQTPSVIEAMEKDLADPAGKSPVLQLVKSTNAASPRRERSRSEPRRASRMAKRMRGSRKNWTSAPRDILNQYLLKAFPTTRYEEYVTPDGEKGYREVARPTELSDGGFRA